MILDITKSKTVDLISTNNNILECMDKCIKLWTHKMDLPEALSINGKARFLSALMKNSKITI